MEYVKQYRLNQAALILKKNDVSITEVAESVGFGNQSYFGTCFKKQFGMTPVEYSHEKQKR